MTGADRKTLAEGEWVILPSGRIGVVVRWNAQEHTAVVAWRCDTGQGRELAEMRGTHLRLARVPVDVELE